MPSSPFSSDPLPDLAARIQTCSQCPRLRTHCTEIAQKKRRAYLQDTYWGLPVAGFGPLTAQLVILGLAPGAHGANRTGRVFTGDRSGEWLYRAIHRAGFSNQPISHTQGDSLSLINTYITCVVKCAPPDNRPLPEEEARCKPYLKEELAALKNARIYLVLGQFALKSAWPVLAPGIPRPPFKHGAQVQLSAQKSLLMSYHPSQQNTFTGRLTEPSFDAVFTDAKILLEKIVSGTAISRHEPT